jgi:hypothetical protein
MSKHEYLEVKLDAARTAESRGDPVMAAYNYSAALFSVLSIAVTAEVKTESALKAMHQLKVVALLESFFRHNETLRVDIRNGKRPASVIGGSYHTLAFAHLSWLLDLPSTARSLIECALTAEVSSLDTPFWKDYGRALGAFDRKETYTPKLPKKLRGLENHWSTYLKFIEAVTHSRDGRAEFEEIKQSFELSDPLEFA